MSDTSGHLGDMWSMKSLKLALLTLLIASTAAAAPCDRPAVLPAALPLVACPVRATGAVCTARCPEHGEYANLFYRDAPATLAVAWRAALTADGWKVTQKPTTLDPDHPGESRRRAIIVKATKGKAWVESVILVVKDETLLTLTYTPR